MKKSPKIAAEAGSKERFERAVDYMLSTPPNKHEPLGKKKKPKKPAKK
jgi:hypothetical protein